MLRIAGYSQDMKMYRCSPQRLRAGLYDVEFGRSQNVAVEWLQFLLCILKLRVELSSWRTDIMNEAISIFL